MYGEGWEEPAIPSSGSMRMKMAFFTLLQGFLERPNCGVVDPAMREGNLINSG